MTRCNLDKVYHFNEYNKTSDYAKQNLAINGVKEQILKLQEEAEKYKREIKTITEPERAQEESRYRLWEKWDKARKICKWTAIGLAASWIVMMILGGTAGRSWSGGMQTVWNILWLFILFLTLPGVLAFLITKAGAWICEKNYVGYMDKVITKIDTVSYDFVGKVNSCYKEIDNLYLRSLDPSHREMVLMRREQAEHNRKQEELEEERIRLENARLNEAERTRKAQEKLLKIEEEREKRYRGY